MGIFDKIFGKKNREPEVKDISKEKEKVKKKRIVEPNVVKKTTGSNDNIHILLERIIAEPSNRYELKLEVGKLGRPAIKSLLNSLRADSVKLREVSAIGIEGIADNGKMLDLESVILEAIDPLIQTLKDNSPTVRKAAVGALRKIILGYYVDTKYMDMGNPRLRNLVCEIINPIVSMLDDESIDVRLATAGVLCQYSGIENVDGFTWGDNESADRARKILIAALDHESVEVRKFAAKEFLYDPRVDENVRKKAEKVLKDKVQLNH